MPTWPPIITTSNQSSPFFPTQPWPPVPTYPPLGPGSYLGQGTYIPGGPTLPAPPGYTGGPYLPGYSGTGNNPVIPGYNAPVGGGGGGYPAPPAAGGGGGGGGGGAGFNGHYAEGPFGNWMDQFGTWHDAWGNTIPHAGYVPGGGGPGTPPELRYLVDQNPDGTPIAPAVPAPNLPSGPIGGTLPPVAPVMPTTFYQPMGPTNSLQLSNQFLALLDPNTRLALDEQLQRARFAPTGQIGQYGETTYFATGAEDLSQILDSNIRQWIRWFLGQMGYGGTYQLPSSYTGGIPMAPPNAVTSTTTQVPGGVISTPPAPPGY